LCNFSISDISGEILAKEGTETTTTITDVISSIWTDYNEIGSQILKDERLNYLIIENEDSYLIATHLYGYIVCLKADIKQNLGMLKIQLEAIVKFLYEKFGEFKDIISNRSES
jgi:hypothetical protein